MNTGNCEQELLCQHSDEVVSLHLSDLQILHDLRGVLSDVSVDVLLPAGQLQFLVWRQLGGGGCLGRLEVQARRGGGEPEPGNIISVSGQRSVGLTA